MSLYLKFVLQCDLFKMFISEFKLSTCYSTVECWIFASLFQRLCFLVATRWRSWYHLLFTKCTSYLVENSRLRNLFFRSRVNIWSFLRFDLLTFVSFYATEVLCALALTVGSNILTVIPHSFNEPGSAYFSHREHKWKQAWSCTRLSPCGLEVKYYKLIFSFL